MNGKIYILENTEAQRVKVGCTMNNPALRVEDMNDLWSGRKGTCQVCGSRRVVGADNLMPRHYPNGIECFGGGFLPVASDTEIAEAHLRDLEQEIKLSTGVEKGSAVRQAKKLRERIGLYKNKDQLVGTWKLVGSYDALEIEEIEKRVHELLSAHLDLSAPFGEIFRCSPDDAKKAIEEVLAPNT